MVVVCPECIEIEECMGYDGDSIVGLHTACCVCDILSMCYTVPASGEAVGMPRFGVLFVSREREMVSKILLVYIVLSSVLFCVMHMVRNESVQWLGRKPCCVDESGCALLFYSKSYLRV